MPFSLSAGVRLPWRNHLRHGSHGFFAMQPSELEIEREDSSSSSGTRPYGSNKNAGTGGIVFFLGGQLKKNGIEARNI